MGKYFDILAFLMGKQAAGGGGDVTVESKSISSNGTYTAPSGKAYSPVTVNVPNSYAAGDEGKVVSNGQLVAQSSDTVEQNGTVDTTLINSLLVNVSGVGGGLEYEMGTWTPSEDTAVDVHIPFSRSHTSAPFFYVIADTNEEYSDVTSSYYCTISCNLESVFGSGMAASPTTKHLALELVGFRYTATGLNYTNYQAITASQTEEWATNEYIVAKSPSSSRYWRSGRTYKWIAVWAPTA